MLISSFRFCAATFILKQIYLSLQKCQTEYMD